MRGQKVKESEYYPGLRLGLGIHHHGVDSCVRDAVESGLRMGYLKVVLCDSSFGFGINMPVKTVVIIGDGESLDKDDDEENQLDAELVIQAAGRAGRWGLDPEGSIIFMNCTEKESNCLWDEFKSPETKFPINIALTFILMSGNTFVKENIPSWFSFPISYWQWNSAEKTLISHCEILQRIGLFDRDYGLSVAGKVALTLFDEGNPALLAGYLFHQGDQFSQQIRSKKDFLFVATHFLKKWRCVWKGSPTLTSDTSLNISEDLKQTVKMVRKSLLLIIPELEILKTKEITSFYVVFPNITNFEVENIYRSDLKSYCAHFIQKMKTFQRIAQLPFGDEAIESMEKYLNGFK